MNHQAFRVADIGQVREQLQIFDEALPGFQPAANSETHDRTCAARQVFLRQRVIGTGLQARIIHPAYARVLER